MFGIANQLLAAVALTVGTSVLINAGKARYAWVTLVPLVVLTAITQSAGFLSIRDNYLPQARGADAAKAFQGALDAGLTAVMMTCMLLVLVEAILRWRRPVTQPGDGRAPVSDLPADACC
jgi:carbon starvation protein